MKTNKMCVCARTPLPCEGWWVVLLMIAASVTNAQSPTADSFNPWAQYGTGYALGVQGDGKVLLGGSYHNLGYGAAFQYRENIARLYADGTIEPVYNPGTDGAVYATLVQSDCRVVLGGNFKTCDGRSRTNLARLNPDGTLDTGFNAGVVTSAGSLPGVHALALQPADNKLIVAGGFSTCGGQPHANIARLNPDGSGDGTFTPSTDGGVYAVALQTDGKILIGGNFTTVNGVLRTNLARLNPGGGLDTTFTASAYIPNGFPWPYVVSCLAVQADGKILVGGQFNTVNDQPANGLARLDGSSGALDLTFTSGLTPLNLPTMYMPTVEGLAVQTDGNILVCGSIDALSGSLTKLIRLNSTGAADSSFYPMPDRAVPGLGIQADGKILAGGQFTMLGGTSRHGYGRLNNPSAASQSLTFNASSITWYRSGASPEVWRTTFEYSADGSTWTTTSGTRISGGWQKTGLSLPANPCIRVRGHLTGGIHNGSSWFVENTAGKPFITVQPASRTNNAGSTTAFSVWAGGSPTLKYQWRKGTTSLTDGGKVSGVTNAILTITNVLGGDAGDYTVVITNLSGSVTSSVAVLRVIDPGILTQPQTVSTNVGATANFSVTAAGTPTLSYQWRKNGIDVANGTASSLAVTNVQAADSGSAFTVVVINGYGSVTSAVATLLVNLSTPDDFNPGANDTVSSLALQTDGKILVGSDSASPFTTLNGQACTNFGRLTAAGILDSSFTRETSPGPRISSITVQTNGQILAGGTFYKLGGQWRTNVAQLNPDGAANADFHPQANGMIYCTTLLTNGQMLVGGSFTTLAGQACTNFGRLNLDGSLDTSFRATANNAPYGLAVQSDGKIVVWGSFTTLNGVARNYIGRLAANGDLDSFNPSANNVVQCAALQPNGAVVFAGFFSQVNATPRSYLARVDQSGALDSTFTPGANNAVYSLALQADGRILAGGAFTTLGGQPARYLGRLNADGTPDNLFIPNPDGSVNCVALQRDGNILLAGAFTSVAGQPRNRIARLVNSDAATQSLALLGSKVTWLRGGSSPEIYGASFGYSTDGTNWVSLGNATRVAGGWELPGVAIPFNAVLRAQGLVAGGYRNNSAWLVETVQPPLITVQPVSRTNAPGTVATFSVQAVGPTLTYQWFKDGTGLSDVGNVSGAQTATLVLDNVSTSDRGGYSVLVTNVHGSVTSVAATLTINAASGTPTVVTQPTNVTVLAGANASFVVVAVGDAELRYQWRHDGSSLAGATSALLSLTAVQDADAGWYDVIVTNSSGSVTSAVAVLSVVQTNVTFVDSFNPGANAPVYAFAEQSEGKTLVAGNFTMLGGAARARIARLQSDGQLDTTFAPTVTNNAVIAMAVQTNGSILLGGYFTQIEGQARSYLGRIDRNGNLDTNFNVAASGPVNALALQPDGKILVGGFFGSLGAQSRAYLGRLSASGDLDGGFNPGADDSVFTLAVQRDGRILVGGHFTQLAGQSRSHLGRLEADGTLDASFDPQPNNDVVCFALQPDGKLIVAGFFTNICGQTRGRIARLNANGTLDTNFVANANQGIFSLALQADGKILVGGTFTELCGEPRNRCGRLNADGRLDGSFDPDLKGASVYSEAVYSLAVQTDGKLLLGGIFDTIAGQPRTNIVRLNTASPALERLALEGSTLTWQRGGSSPECSRVTFASSLDATNWLELGSATPIANGWQLTGFSVAPPAILRARGLVTGGQYSSSSWFVESLHSLDRTPPSILLVGGNFGIVTNAAGTNLFGFDIAAKFGQVVVVEASDDHMATWFVVATYQYLGSLVHFTDTQPATRPMRMYRVRLQ